MKNLLKNQAYACPICKEPLRKQPGWDILHCLKCQRSIDLWHDPEPSIIEVKEKVPEYDYFKNVVVLKMPKQKQKVKISRWKKCAHFLKKLLNG